MSKVKIQGNASGTGIFTVAAPATNTDRTITLPDVDATVMTSAGGIMTARLDHDYAGDNIRLRGAGTHRITSTSGNPTYQLASSGGSAIAFVTDGSHDYINFETHWTGVQHAVAMTIDGKGRVTKPYQPAFYAMSNNNTFTSTQAIAFEDVYVNRGSHYNPANGRFTAPVTGAYHFSANFLKRGGAGRLLFHKNDSYYGSGNSQAFTSVNETMLAATIIITLAVNDYITVIGSIDAGDVYGNSNSHNGFSGFLIG